MGSTYLNILAYSFCDLLCQCVFYSYYKIHLKLETSDLIDLPEDGHVNRTMLEYNKIQTR